MFTRDLLDPVRIGSAIWYQMGDLRPGLHDIGLLFMQDRFSESGTKTHRSMSVYTEPENSPLTLFRAKIISLRLPYLLFSLPICQAIDQLHLH